MTEAIGTEDGKKTGTALTGKGDRMATVNIEHDENAVEYAKKFGQYFNQSVIGDGYCYLAERKTDNA